MQSGINMTEPLIATKRELTASVLSNMQAGLSVYDAIINAAINIEESQVTEKRARLRMLGLKFLLCVNCVNLVTCSNIGEVTQCMPSDQKEDVRVVGNILQIAASLSWLLL